MSRCVEGLQRGSILYPLGNLRFCLVAQIQGKNCLTAFHGMDFTTDKIRSLVRKWQTLIEAHIDVRTTDGYLVRLFAIAFTRKNRQQVKKTTYAQSSQIRQIRQKMFEIMKRESECELKELVQKFVPESIGREIEKATKVSILSCKKRHDGMRLMLGFFFPLL